MSEQTIHITGPMTIVVTTRLEVVKGEPVDPVLPEVAVNSPQKAGLRVRTLGALQAWAVGEEVSSVLDGRRVQRFVWLYLLARELLKPGNPILRSALMDELYPGIDPDQQRLRMRQVLFTMARQLPSPMAACVKVEGDSVRFDASGCDVDARRLLDLAKAVEGQWLPLPDETLADIEAALIEASEEFIPEWEDIEDQGTGAHSGESDHPVRSFRSARVGGREAADVRGFNHPRRSPPC